MREGASVVGVTLAAVVAVLLGSAPAPPGGPAPEVLAVTGSPSGAPLPPPPAPAPPGGPAQPSARALAPAGQALPVAPRAARNQAAVPPRAVGGAAPDPGTAVADVRRVPGRPAPRPSAAPRPSTAGDRRVVVGLDDYLFISQDWRIACQYAGKAGQAAQTLAEVTQALRDSGRPVTVAIAPNKSSVMTGQVPAQDVPDRACGEQSSREYWAAITTDGGPGVLDLRPALRRSAETDQPYWRLDTHWSPTGGSVYARELAQALAPGLAVGLGSERGTYELDGDLARTLGRPEIERIEALSTTSRGVTWQEEAPRSVGLRNPLRRTTATVSQPGGQLIPGRTVFVGDSMTAIAIAQLAPLFEEAVFVWAIPEDPLQPVLDQLVDADRVVLESVERIGWQFRMLGADVAPALRSLPPRRG